MIFKKTVCIASVLVAAILAGMAIAADGFLQVLAASKTSTAPSSGPADVPAGEWPGYRGAGRNGISNEKFAIPAGGFKKLWNKNVGGGWSSFAVSDGMVFTMGNKSGKDTVWCFKADTGEEVWKYSYDNDGKARSSGYYSPQSTPSVDDKNVYTLGNMGDLYCLNKKTGTPVWNKKMSDFGAKEGICGFACSPLVTDEALIVDVGVIVSFNKATGAENWKIDLGKAGYSSPVSFKQSNQQLLAVFPQCGLVIVDMASGKEVKKFAWKTPYGENTPMPIIVDPAKGDKVFISSGHGVGCALVDVTSGSAVWQNKNMCNNTSTCCLLEGYLYGFSGDVPASGVLTCMDISDGSVKWSQNGMGGGDLIIADGKMIILTADGSLVIAEATPNGYKELAKIDGAVKGKKCLTAPVLAGGRIFCRSEAGDVACFDVSGK